MSFRQVTPAVGRESTPRKSLISTVQGFCRRPLTTRRGIGSEGLRTVGQPSAFPTAPCPCRHATVVPAGVPSRVGSRQGQSETGATLIAAPGASDGDVAALPASSHGGVVLQESRTGLDTNATTARGRMRGCRLLSRHAACLSACSPRSDRQVHTEWRRIKHPHHPNSR